MGTPVIGLYAVAPSKLSGPYLSPELVIDRFPEAVRTILSKDPARIPWGTRVHTPRAMELIQVPEVIEKLGMVFWKRE
jgi:heptosyltransferase I